WIYPPTGLCASIAARKWPVSDSRAEPCCSANAALRRGCSPGLIAQIFSALAHPGLLVTVSQRIQVLRRRGLGVDPLSQQRPAVDHVNGELAVLIFVGEVAPQRIVQIQAANRLESDGLQSPGLERLVVVAGTFGMNLYAAAELADMFVKGG